MRCNLFSDNGFSNDMQNVLKGNYEEVLQNNLFLRLYNEMGHLKKPNFNLNVIKHLSDFLSVNPQE